MPLLCCLAWRRFEGKRTYEVQRRLTQILVMQRGPHVEHVAFLLATGLKHWKTLSSRFTLKGRPWLCGQWIGQALRFCAGAVELSRQVEHARDRQLRLDVGEIDEGVLVGLGVVC